jgi:hypothetical protein
MLRHVSLIFRHGDRSPTFNAMEPIAQAATIEAATWASSLPPTALRADLDRRYPVHATPETIPRDQTIPEPFASLTGLGVLQMRRLGAFLSEKAGGGRIMRPNKILASNFKRTQLSAQCVLAGLTNVDHGIKIQVEDEGKDVLNVWGADPLLRKLLRSDGVASSDVMKNTKEEDEAKAIIIRAVPCFNYLLRPFTWISALDHTMCREGKTGGGGPLRGRAAPKRAEELFKNMDVKGEGRLSREALKQGLDSVLQSAFAGERDIDWLIDQIDKDRSGYIELIELMDYLRNLRLPPPQDNVTEEEFWDAARVVERAVCRRFESIMEIPTVKRLTAGAVTKKLSSDLNDVITNLSQQAKELKQQQPPISSKQQPNKPATSTPIPITLNLYSAHDVTLVPLLRALKVWTSKEPWPGVSAALALEVICKDDGSNAKINFTYYKGVRGSLSGLEPRVLGLEPVKVKLNNNNNSQPEESCDLDKFIEFSSKL